MTTPISIPLTNDASEFVTFHPGGWGIYTSPDTGSACHVLLRVESDPGRTRDTPLRIAELQIISLGDGFPSTLMRQFPPTRIEAAINIREHRTALTGLSSEPCGPPEPTATITPEQPVLPSLNISDPGGYRKPDAFYMTVADLYLRLAAISGRPAQDIAEANRIPSGTVHRWIREARSRGLLVLPGHRGERPCQNCGCHA